MAGARLPRPNSTGALIGPAKPGTAVYRATWKERRRRTGAHADRITQRVAKTGRRLGPYRKVRGARLDRAFREPPAAPGGQLSLS